MAKKLLTQGTESVTNYTHTTNSSNKNPAKETFNMTKPNLSDDTSTPLLITKIMESIKNLVTTEEDFRDEPSLPLCDETPPDLGKLQPAT